jgi:hypothetical protein
MATAWPGRICQLLVQIDERRARDVAGLVLLTAGRAAELPPDIE